MLRFATISEHIDCTSALALFYVQYLTDIANSKKVELVLQLFLRNQKESRDCNLILPDSTCSVDHDDDGEIRKHMLKFNLDMRKLVSV